MRRFLSTALIFLGIIAASPYITGFIVHGRYQEVINIINETGNVRLTTTKYERSWLTSVVETYVEITDPRFLELYQKYQGGNRVPRDQDKPIGFYLEHKISHGPLIYDEVAQPSQKRFIWGQALIYTSALLPENQTMIKTEFKNQAELSRARTKLNIDGAGESFIQSIAFEYKDPDSGDGIAWKGLEGTWTFNSNLKQIESNFSMPGIALIDGDDVLTFSDLSFSSEYFRKLQNLWLGTTSTSIAQMTVGDKEKPVITLRSLKIGTKSTAEDKSIDTAINVIGDQAIVGDRYYGPGRFNLALNNLDAQALSKMKTFINKEQQEGKALNPLAIADEFTHLLPDILKKEPEFLLDIVRFKTPEGDISGIIDISLGGPKIEQLVTPLHIIETINAKLELRLPKATVEHIIENKVKDQVAIENEDKPLSQGEFILEVRTRTKKELEALESSGWLKKRAKYYDIRASFKDQILEVNGEEKSIPFF